MGSEKALQGSLAGLKVLDASRVLAGPFAGQMLADLGADVVKIEEPAAGDETRAWGPPDAGGLSAYFMACNRGKRSVTLDLKSAGGLKTFLALVTKADVVLINFTPQLAARLGVGNQTLLQTNPKAVVVSISGYGAGHARSERPGYDFVVQGMSGMMAMTGPADGEPHKFGVAIADLVTGHYAALAALAALRQRDRTGQGCIVELALIDCAVATMANVAQAYLVAGKSPKRQGNAHLQIVPYQVFQTADRPLVLAVGNDRQWRQFCAAAGAQGLEGDRRYATNPGRLKHRDELTPQLAIILKGKTAAAWEALLSDAGVPCGPVWSVPELFDSDLAKARRLTVRTTLLDGTSVELLNSPMVDLSARPLPPPRLGQHTDEVIKEWL